MYKILNNLLGNYFSINWKTWFLGNCCSLWLDLGRIYVLFGCFGWIKDGFQWFQLLLQKLIFVQTFSGKIFHICLIPLRKICQNTGLKKKYGLKKTRIMPYFDAVFRKILWKEIASKPRRFINFQSFCYLKVSSHKLFE